MLKDRHLVDKSQDAFVSYLRYYKEHQLSFIFAFSLLDIGQVANSFFLFRLPRVKEILGKKVEGFKTRHDVDINKIEYKDKNQTKQHEEHMRKRELKFAEKKQVIEEAKVAKIKDDVLKKSSKSVRMRHKKEMDWEEWDDMADEIREMKKEKRAQKKGLNKI